MVSQAEAGVAQAQAGVSQAQARLDAATKNLGQAQAELDLIDAQIEKLTVYAPVGGVVLTRNIEPGEVVQPGAVALTIGDLQELTITVFLPEDRYGQIALGEHATVQVDSYPEQPFDSTVVRIADQAEFTPRNVQTAEGRRTTVFAVELSINNPDGKLKPGMPADVKFSE
jgi:HlyD family secretion protein